MLTRAEPEARSTRDVGADSLAERSLEIETPEHVAVGYELAGAGSRFSAFLFDTLLLFLLLAAVMLVLVGVLIATGGGSAVTIFFALAMLGWFAITWGYFIFFEGMREGQTPGKKRMGLRVVQSNGFPVTLKGAVIRNLLRVIDLQPFPSCLLGGTMVVLHSRAQRLGDLAAGTVVVRERAVATLPEEVDAEGPPRLSDAEYEILHSYLIRRDAMDRMARRRLAGTMGKHFNQYMDAGGPTEQVLATLYADESGRRRGTGAGSGSGSPAAAALFRQQRTQWKDYERLLQGARRGGLAALEEEEVSRFAALYREVATDLARARTYGASPQMLFNLERSVGTGHNLLYSGSVRSARSAWRWLATGFPTLVRQRHRVILASTFLFFAPAIATFIVIADDPSLARTIVPAGMIARAENAPERAAAGRGYAEVPEILMPIFSSQIITNNIQVSFFAFAGGILAGLGTLFILLTNGLMLGGVAGLFRAAGADLYLWSFVMPHGVIELTAICIAGGAGLWMGSAILLPARQTRRAALVHRAREAVSLLGGVVVLLLIAGLIEGFISPSRLPDGAKLAFGALTAVILFPYLLLSGREPASTPKGG